MHVRSLISRLGIVGLLAAAGCVYFLPFVPFRPTLCLVLGVASGWRLRGVRQRVLEFF